MAAKQIPLGKFIVGGKLLSVKVAATGLYVNRRVAPANRTFNAMPKGEVRRLRKALRSVGRTDLAAASRLVS